METIEIRTVNTAGELEKIFEIRQKVFVEEQQVDPELEYDEFEDRCTHFIALYNNVPAGTARWRRTPNGIKLERFAVLPEYRRKGLASGLINSILQDLPDLQNVYLHSQVQVCELYQKHGFKPEGEMFSEAGIDHYKMVFRNS
ncbi:MAG: GNAT family N-acetyltransferase [Bacteroidetes bacterium]|nr:GNAT family N-acetyltransferase [Bacteroidota bacterium]